MGGRWGGRLEDPIFWNDVLQLVKTVVAAVIAWVVAASVLELPQPFLAPWAALLVVHSTVYRTFSRGMRQVAGTVVAVLLASLVGNLLGLDTVAVAVLLVLALAMGSLPWLGAEVTTIATTALVVLTTGFTDDTLLLSRLLDTGIGVGVGLLVNFAVWPPLRRRTAILAMNRIDDGIGELLVDIGTGLAGGRTDVEEWVERSRDLDGEIDHAWALVRQARESARMNPRRSAGEFRDPQQWHGLLHRLEQAVAETRSMARTLGGQNARRSTWDPAFAEGWTPLLTAAGRAVSAASPEEIAVVREQLESLVDEASTGALAENWPVHGALAINLRNILDSMDEVAVVNPLGQPPAPLSRIRRGPRRTPGSVGQPAGGGLAQQLLERHGVAGGREPEPARDRRGGDVGRAHQGRELGGSAGDPAREVGVGAEVVGRREDAGRDDDRALVGEERPQRVVEHQRVARGAGGGGDQHRRAVEHVGLQHVDEHLEQAAVRRGVHR